MADACFRSYRQAVGFTPAGARALYWHAADAAHWQTGPEFRCRRDSYPGHQLMFMLRGAGDGAYLGDTWRAGAGQAVLMDLGLPHEYHSDPADPWEMLWVICAGPGIDAHFAAITEGVGPVVPFASAKAVKRAFSGLFSAMERRDPGQAGWVHHHLAALFADLYEARCRGTDPVGDDAAHERSPIARALALMRREHARVIAIDELARAAGLSASHFVRRFKRQTGFTPIEYLERYRIARAQELLRAERHRPVAEIGASVGYPDPAYFSRVFRRCAGVPPQRYRLVSLAG